MTHISKIDGAAYDISYSCDYHDGKHDDITLIWFSPNSPDLPPTIFIGWYYGSYDYNITEQYIAAYKLKNLDSKSQISTTEFFNQLNKAYPSNAYRIITQLFMAQEIAGLFQYQEVNDKVLDALFDYYCDSDYNIFELFDAIDTYCFDNDMDFEDYLRAKGYLD